MELQDVLRHLKDNLNIEISSEMTNSCDNDNQKVKIVIKLGDDIVSESETTLYIG